ncbi:Tenascin-R [Holothuria leucospilota]|uniref:Tenascin-R n=1 Tax=Holothuria leucospilota TaxID=206669 RepID=A0A9Q1CN86_HOLLE|nr:Tenascin-R [Holothuria leucospilota]
MIRERGQEFETPDRHNDVYSYDCADVYDAGWWYKNCYTAKLNAVYGRTGDNSVELLRLDPNRY